VSLLHNRRQEFHVFVYKIQEVGLAYIILPAAVDSRGTPFITRM